MTMFLFSKNMYAIFCFHYLFCNFWLCNQEFSFRDISSLSLLFYLYICHFTLMLYIVKC